MKCQHAIVLACATVLLPAGTRAAEPYAQDLGRIAKWVKAAPSMNPVDSVWMRALRELNCSPAAVPTAALERQVLRCAVDPQRAAAVGSVVTQMELQTDKHWARYPERGEVWQRRLSFHFLPGKGPTAGALSDMKLKKMRLLPVSIVPSPHGPSPDMARICPIDFDVETAPPVKRLTIGTGTQSRDCTGNEAGLAITVQFGPAEPVR
jgi:hypothetical protein